MITAQAFAEVSSPLSAHYAARKKVTKYEASDRRETVDSIINNFHTDYYFGLFGGVEAAVDLILRLIELTKKGGFHLTKSIPKSPGILEVVQVNQQRRIGG